MLGWGKGLSFSSGYEMPNGLTASHGAAAPNRMHIFKTVNGG